MCVCVWVIERKTDNTPLWFQNNSFSVVAKCSSLCEIEANVNLVVQLKERKKEKKNLRLYTLDIGYKQPQGNT